MRVDLTDLESAELSDLLDEALGDLGMEIADTDNPSFRRRLEQRRDQLDAVRRKLDSPDDWIVDEQGEESFPASDPPAH